MMANMFSIFDPSTSYTLSLNWLSTPLFLLMSPYIYWTTHSRNQSVVIMVTEFIMVELKPNTKPSNTKALVLFMSLFFFIVWNNILGLFPYIFTSPTQLMMTLALALPAWTLLTLYGWIENTKHMMLHMLPSSTPTLLSVFMVIIETTSNLIRPITLSVRLTANMIAGHLLLSLLSSISENNWLMFLPTSFSLILLLSLEISVAIIQSYVFMTLLTLYIAETK